MDDIDNEIVRNAKITPASRGKYRRVYAEAKKFERDGKVFRIISETPEQFEDVYRVLVDDTIVVGFEISRITPEASPVNVQSVSVSDYVREISGRIAKQKFNLAIRLAREELSR